MSDSSQGKPREWWVERKNMLGGFWEAYIEPGPGTIPVIEKIFYDQLAVELARLKKKWTDETHIHDEYVAACEILKKELAEARAEIEELLCSVIEVGKVEIENQIISIYEKALKEIANSAAYPYNDLSGLDSYISIWNRTLAEEALSEAEKLKCST